MLDLTQRPRRLRRTPLIREMIHEVDLHLDHLVQPYFLATQADAKEPIAGFTDVYRHGIDSLSRVVEADIERGLKKFLLFGYAADEFKDSTGSRGHQTEATLAEALRCLRKRFGNHAVLFSDVCLCTYTDHGHCGVVGENGIENDASLDWLAKMALVHAQAGADFVAPSDMMDGRVGAIRKNLDEAGHSEVGILAYTAKYASSYYGPFRGALNSAPKGTDRASYQMDYRNITEAMRELALDQQEGADIVMVKPALAYLDVIARFREASNLPIAAYSVSGEYEMVKQLAKSGMAEEQKLVLENLTAIRRAGAQLIITYHATQAAEKGWVR